MRFLLAELNTDQLEKLADLLMDLAKAAFVLAFLSPAGPKIFHLAVIDMSKGIISGLAFAYLSLLVLRLKGVKRL